MSKLEEPLEEWLAECCRQVELFAAVMHLGPDCYNYHLTQKLVQTRLQQQCTFVFVIDFKTVNTYFPVRIHPQDWIYDERIAAHCLRMYLVVTQQIFHFQKQVGWGTCLANPNTSLISAVSKPDGQPTEPPPHDLPGGTWRLR